MFLFSFFFFANIFFLHFIHLMCEKNEWKDFLHHKSMISSLYCFPFAWNRKILNSVPTIINIGSQFSRKSDFSNISAIDSCRSWSNGRIQQRVGGITVKIIKKIMKSLKLSIGDSSYPTHLDRTQISSLNQLLRLQ